MNIIKETAGGTQTALSAGDLELIAGLARRPLEPEEVYTFAVRLCDNEIDRDLERFDRQTLEELGRLFVGKSGIFDHRWSALGQAARIYKTELVQENGQLTRAGDEYCWLKGYVYMVRTGGNQDLIAEIEGGIKKEVSVGCAVERARCSVCGRDRTREDCGHQKGEHYDGQLCYAVLEGALDAYEFSFVAVPAQPRAGVVKSWRGDERPRRLEEEAELGRKFLERMREEVVRLALLADDQLDAGAVRALTDRLPPAQLETLRQTWARRAGQRLPVKTQLSYQNRNGRGEEDNWAFLA